MVVKAALTSGVALESLLAHNVYDKEIEFYGEIAPKINKMLKKLNEPNILVAESFGVCKDDKVMLFDDLTLKGYCLPSIKRGLNIAEAKAILKRYATFHATSAVLQENEPECFANYKHGTSYFIKLFAEFERT